jgi:hypothetical protein
MDCPTFLTSPEEAYPHCGLRAVCAGELVMFSAERPVVSGTSQRGDFGDPAAGCDQLRCEPGPVTHRYAQPRTYTVA